MDWPQAVRVDTVNADIVLTRDVKNILKFFSKKFNVEEDSHKIINKIKRNAS